MTPPILVPISFILFLVKTIPVLISAVILSCNHFWNLGWVCIGPNPTTFGKSDFFFFFWVNTLLVRGHHLMSSQGICFYPLWVSREAAGTDKFFHFLECQYRWFAAAFFSIRLVLWHLNHELQCQMCLLRFVLWHLNHELQCQMCLFYWGFYQKKIN